MGNIDVQVGGKKIAVDEKATFFDVAQQVKDDYKEEILLAKQGSVLQELHKKIQKDKPITFYDMTSPDGIKVYQRGMLFLLIRSVWELYGKENPLMVHHSLKGSVYCEIKGKENEITDDLLQKISDVMNGFVQKEVPFMRDSYARTDAMKMLEDQLMFEKSEILRFRRSSKVNLYEFEGMYDYFYGTMPYTTKGLHSFKLEPYKQGFMLTMPKASNPREVVPFDEPPKIGNAYMEQLSWFKLMGVSNVADLNNTIVDGKFGDLIRINEALHEKKIANIADSINEKIDDVKVVLIAGPSSSGKTSFANRLCIQLQALGLKAKKISLDDYFIPWEEVPLDEDGEKDLESINTLDLKLLNSDLKKIIAGEKVEIPSYNFVLGRPEYKGNFLQLHDGEILVMEGIHGLNDMLTAEIPDKNKFKVFISAMTQLNLDSHNRISTTDSRLLRRMVRDHRTRGNDANETLNFWHKVIAGEEKNIFPYQENADAVFNSATIYELSVLKQYAEPLLFSITEDQEEFIMAKRMIKFLGYFLSAPSTDIPNNSLIKEFIGGSCFKV